MDLGEDISSAQITDTVDDFDRCRDHRTGGVSMPEETWDTAMDGMTSDPKVLRDCVTKVTTVETPKRCSCFGRR